MLTHPIQSVDANIMYALTIRESIMELSGSEAYSHALHVIDERNLSPTLKEWLASAHETPPDDYVTQMGWVKTALQNAFHHLAHTDTFENALRLTVERGGDTDTNACILGALKGATDGLSNIPEQWQQSVMTCRPMTTLKTVHRPRPRRYWPVDALHLAERLIVG